MARDRGTGSIYRRTDGRWVGAVSVVGADGRRRRPCVYGKSRREVSQKLRDLQDRVEAGLLSARGALTVAEMLADYLEYNIAPNQRPKTLRNYAQAADRHIVPDLGNLRVQDLDARRLQQHFAGLLAAGLAPATVQLARAVLSGALAQEERAGTIPRNPCGLVRIPRAARTEIPQLTAGEVARLVAAIGRQEYGRPLLLCLSQGLRRGEALGLRWQDVDAKRGLLTVAGQMLYAPGKSLHLGPTKTRASAATIPLTPFAARVLEEERRAQAEAGAAGSDGLVFTMRSGKRPGLPVHANTLLRAMNRARAEAGQPTLTIHKLRHLCASFLVAERVNPVIIAGILRHADPAITTKVYSHVLAGGLEGAAGVIEQALRTEGAAP